MFGGGANAQPANAFGASTTGFGAQPAAQPTNNGTGSTPFSAFIEKDNASSANSHYQSITFMQPYQAFSFEELRLADYSAGRKSGNANGQAGAFGQSTGFGSGFNSGAATTGFGAPQATNTGGGMFGAQTSAPATGGFGAPAANTNTTSGFGAGGGLFGQQNKPAPGGLFGSTPASTGTTGGGMFGTTNNNTATTSTGFGGFGATNNTQQPAQANAGGLFGANQNTTQNKPAFGGFGGTPAATTPFGASSTGGFGQPAQTNTTGGTGMFGQSATNTASPFGGAQQNNAPAANSGGLFGSGGNAFGQNNQNQQQQQPQTGTTNLFGGGGGAFGQNNQQKPSPFGGASTGTSGGLFGNAQPQQNNTGGGLFGAAQPQQNTGGGMFGAPKPAATGNLFGGAQPQNTGSSLFGGAQTGQSTGGGLFGGQANQQKPAGGLFGGSGGFNNPSIGNGQNQQQNAGGSLFGGSTQQSGQSNGMFGQSNQQQSSFAATLLTNPYGNDQLFSNLGNPAPAVGPIATPLSGAQKPAKRPAALPQFKINPSASLRLITPQKRSNGYGFSYATYGTPGSAQSFTSNGLGSSLLQSGGLSRSLGKSFSTSSLNKSVGSGDSVLAPGAFTPNNRSYSGGSIRRLKIDRNLRTDLFGDNTPIEPPTKRVSFDEGDKGKTSTNGYVETPANSALVRTETDGPEPSSEDLGYSRAERPTTNGASVNGTSSTNQARGNELAMVPEDGPAPASSKSVSSKDLPRSQADPQPGEYWMTPSMDDIRNMSRQQLKSVSGFTVGRHGVGKVEFDPVDLTQVPLDEIIDDIVKLNVRQVTVYTTGVNTPPMGQGLNVPSTITLENSWPRAQAGRLPVHERKGQRYEKHIERLQRVQDTEFISYDPVSGFWVFRVPHFTTYGLDDDESDDEAEYGSDAMNTSQQPTPKGNNTAVQEMSQVSSEDGSVISDEDDESNPDDTFDFKKGPSKILPGSFGAQPIHNDDEMADDNDAQDQEEDSSYLEQQDAQSHEDPFRSSGSSNARPVEAVEVRMEETDYGEFDEEDMAGSFPKPAPTAPAPYNDYGISFSGSLMPKSILKASTMLNSTPKKDLALAGDWAEQLQRTASPKKQDRQALRERQSVMGAPPVDTAPPLAASIAGKAFSTTMDIMNSLWAPSASIAGHGLQASSVGGKGFEV
jgi:nuclear pore complex protein Nup98-Nup96